MKYLVTGAAGFIGMHTCLRLLSEGHIVVGVDNLNDYYEVSLKESRLEKIIKEKKFTFIKLDISDSKETDKLFKKIQPQRVIHLAAQAGVRYSLINPHAYINSNILGFTNILEGCRYGTVEHLVYASSSSVYGSNTNYPFSEHHNVDHPVSLYAATKKANELLAHTYSHLFGLPTTGVRFFTVYGPWGRPDMALYIFTKSIIEGKPINIYNNGEMIRDFTYIEDIIESLIRIANKPAHPNTKYNTTLPDPATSNVPYRIFNIGNNKPIKLLDYINEIEKNLGIKAVKKFMPLQPGDVIETSSNIELLNNWIGYKPKISIKQGIKNFVEWYRMYNKI